MHGRLCALRQRASDTPPATKRIAKTDYREYSRQSIENLLSQNLSKSLQTLFAGRPMAPRSLECHISLCVSTCRGAESLSSRAATSAPTIEQQEDPKRVCVSRDHSGPKLTVRDLDWPRVCVPSMQCRANKIQQPRHEGASRGTDRKYPTVKTMTPYRLPQQKQRRRRPSGR